VFRPHSRNGPISTGFQETLENPYKSIISYLKLLDRDQDYFLAQVEKESALNAETERLSASIQERNRTIEGLNQQLQEFLDLFLARAVRRIARKLSAWFGQSNRSNQ
jgi:predicted chitinase